jgi:(1->4)-alpha-D-glucan 1-alpha-D-glucosylmutase
LLRRRSAILADLCAASPIVANHVVVVVDRLNGRAGDAASFDALHALIKAQAYRLTHWRVAADEINYRRFFDVNELAALRMENPAVFDAVHETVLAMIRRGDIEGLRIDHADGLFDPAGYFRKLQARIAGYRSVNAFAADRRHLPIYLVIEKILAEHEQFPSDWAIHGGTGYRYANLANGLFVDARSALRMSRIYAQFTGVEESFDDIAYTAKKLVIATLLPGELNTLAARFARLAASHRDTCDFTLNSLANALAEVVACFPVYRCYLADDELSPDDRRHVEWAVAVARRRNPAADASIFDFIGAVLTGDFARDDRAAAHLRVLDIARRFQQYTAPVMAKGLEDTAFYRYHRLVSLNEVGGDPRRFGVTPAAFHAAMRARTERWPHSMLAGSTHDSKRSEDVRARINVLSEVPAAWRLSLRRWRRINRSKKRLVDGRPAPSANDEYLLYQTLFGSWPLEASGEAGHLGDDALAAYRERIVGYMRKAVREAKQESSWTRVNEEYEAALTAFVEALLAPGEKNLFLGDFAPATRRLARFGLISSLAQTLIRLTAPGVPDFYQGSELWQFDLVDPDNRRPVDYGKRRRLLAEVRALRAAPDFLRGLAELSANLEDGRAKLYLVWCALELRRTSAELFSRGAYLPLRVKGRHAEHVIAFARILDGQTVVSVAPRLLAKLQGGTPEWQAARWDDTRIELPHRRAPDGWRNVLSGEILSAQSAAGELSAEALFARFPVALLVKRTIAQLA